MTAALPVSRLAASASMLALCTSHLSSRAIMSSTIDARACRTYCRHHPRKRVNQYSRGPAIEEYDGQPSSVAARACAGSRAEDDQNICLGKSERPGTICAGLGNEGAGEHVRTRFHLGKDRR